MRWRLNTAIQTGEFVAPVGYNPDQMLWQWTPDGIPWWNPGDEVRANIEAINAGLKSRAQVRMETDGDDWRDVIDELAEEQKYMKELGVDPNPELTAKMAERKAQQQQRDANGETQSR